MKLPSLILFVASSVFGQLSLATKTYTVSGNFPRDLYGAVDTRQPGTVDREGPTIWGHADSATATIQFYPPVGFSVKILSIRGDLISWIKTLPNEPATPPESKAGTLAGFETPGASGSLHCNLCADGTPVYVQDSVSEKIPNSRAPFNYDGVDLTLGPDNKLVSKVAEFLNTTGKAIHLELTYTIKFTYVPVTVRTAVQ